MHSCRGAVSADKIFHLELFEPTEEEIEHELTILDIKPDIMPVMPSGLYDAEKDEFADVSIGDLLSRRRKDKAKREDKKPVIGSSRDADRKPDLKGKGKAKGTPTWKKPKLVPSTKVRLANLTPCAFPSSLFVRCARTDDVPA